MNSLERSLITKAGYDHGWEVVISENSEEVVLASALHSARAHICLIPPDELWMWSVTLKPTAVHRQLAHALPDYYLTDDVLAAEKETELCFLLENGSRLARALPDEPCRRYIKAVEEELVSQADITSATEIERLVRQRIGQGIYRDCLMDYWGGACAVTGIALPELLRASHAKPWADCTTDAERLNVFNGFLLCAHLDALFDRHLMTFDDTGVAIFAPTVSLDTRTMLGITTPLRLRWVSQEHQPFLELHRKRFWASEKGADR